VHLVSPRNNNKYCREIPTEQPYFKDGSQFGIGAKEEMCIAFIIYSPACDLLGVPWICPHGAPDDGLGCATELEQGDLVSVDELLSLRLPRRRKRLSRPICKFGEWFYLRRNAKLCVVHRTKSDFPPTQNFFALH
jgi:hypothetical protein